MVRMAKLQPWELADLHDDRATVGWLRDVRHPPRRLAD